MKVRDHLYHLCLCLLAFVCLAGIAQEKPTEKSPAVFALTADEQGRISRARNLQADSLNRQRQGNQEIQNLSLRECAPVIAAVAEWQKALRETILASEQLQTITAELRLKHKCERCEISEDGKTLETKVKP
jgi:hypothetical protein